jgi:hypothetical protein
MPDALYRALHNIPQDDGDALFRPDKAGSTDDTRAAKMVVASLYEGRHHPVMQAAVDCPAVLYSLSAEPLVDVLDGEPREFGRGGPIAHAFRADMGHLLHYDAGDMILKLVHTMSPAELWENGKYWPGLTIFLREHSSVATSAAAKSAAELLDRVSAAMSAELGTPLLACTAHVERLLGISSQDPVKCTHAACQRPTQAANLGRILCRDLGRKWAWICGARAGKVQEAVARDLAKQLIEDGREASTAVLETLAQVMQDTKGGTWADVAMLVSALEAVPVGPGQEHFVKTLVEGLRRRANELVLSMT